jgi:hypothetical protein
MICIPQLHLYTDFIEICFNENINNSFVFNNCIIYINIGANI